MEEGTLFNKLKKEKEKHLD